MIGNLVYINTSRMKKDGKKDEKATEADFDGKDDVFNEYGIFQYSLGAGPDIYIINSGSKSI